MTQDQALFRDLEEAMRDHAGGFVKRAARLYGRILNARPDNVDALILLAGIRADEGQNGEAQALLHRAAGRPAANAAVWRTLGLAAVRNGQYRAAIQSYRRSILLAPDTTLGLAGWWSAGDGDAPMALSRRWVLIDPVSVEGHRAAGDQLSASGRKRAGADAYRRAEILAPQTLEIVFPHGHALRDAGDRAGAERQYARALVLSPGHPNVLNNMGGLLLEHGDWAAAESWLRRCLRESPGHLPALANLAHSVLKQGRAEAALSGFRRVLVLDPINVMALCEVAALDNHPSSARRGLCVNPADSEPYTRLALLAAQQPDRPRVMDLLRKSACLRPQDADAWYNLCVEWARAGDPDRAATHGFRTTRIRDRHASAHLNTALALLVRERFGRGWEEHRRRLETTEADQFRRRFEIPEWMGEDLAGGRLLVWGEQGIGDEVQFLTLLPWILSQGIAVTAIVEPRIRPILRRSAPGVDVPEVDTPPDAVTPSFGCTAQVALGDLPHRLRLFCGGDAAPEPWIVPDRARAERLRADLQARHPGKRLVGITWRSDAPRTGPRRTIAIDRWRAVFRVDPVAVVSLQYGLTPEEIEGFRAATGVEIDHQHGIEPIADLDGLVALIAAVDLVIAPANNTVHFAGSVGQECWTLLPTNPDWRWGLERSDSLWYPRMRVFRQIDDGDWGPVMSTVASALGEWSTR